MATGASAANQKDCPASHDLIVRERDLLKSEVVVLSSQLAESRTLYSALAEDHSRLKHQLVGSMRARAFNAVGSVFVVHAADVHVLKR